MILQTPRLILRSWRADDAENLYKYASDPEVGPRAGWPPHKNVEESRAIIESVFSNEYMWAITLRESDEPIGCVGYLPAEACNLDISPDEVEVGAPFGTEASVPRPFARLSAIALKKSTSPPFGATASSTTPPQQRSCSTSASKTASSRLGAPTSR